MFGEKTRISGITATFRFVSFRFFQNKYFIILISLHQCLTNLWIGLQKGLISDVFFPEVQNINSIKKIQNHFQFNMLDRIAKEHQLQICKWLDGLVKKYHSNNSISAIFPQL